jgi:hypothetical protein
LINRNPTFNKSIFVNFTYGDENEIHNQTNLIKPLYGIEFEPFDNNSKTIKLETLDVGHLVIGAISENIKMYLFYFKIIKIESISFAKIKTR